MSSNLKDALVSLVVGLTILSVVILGGLFFKSIESGNRHKVEKITTTCIEAGHEGAADLGTSGFVCVG